MVLECSGASRFIRIEHCRTFRNGNFIWKGRSGFSISIFPTWQSSTRVHNNQAGERLNVRQFLRCNHPPGTSSQSSSSPSTSLLSAASSADSSVDFLGTWFCGIVGSKKNACHWYLISKLYFEKKKDISSVNCFQEYFQKDLILISSLYSPLGIAFGTSHVGNPVSDWALSLVDQSQKRPPWSPLLSPSSSPST